MVGVEFSKAECNRKHQYLKGSKYGGQKRKRKIVGGESIDLFKEKVIIILKGKKFTILDRFNFK